MWLNLFAHQQTNDITLYSAHICAAQEDRDAGGMQSRPPEPWQHLRSAMLNAGIEDEVIVQLKKWLDHDPLRPVQIEVTEEQVTRLGLPAGKPN